MNTALIREFKSFCTSELLWFLPNRDFLLHHTLLIFMFILHKWHQKFDKCLPQSAVEFDVRGLDVLELYEIAKKIYSKHPTVTAGACGNSTLNDAVHMISKEIGQLRNEKKRRAKENKT